MIIDDELLRHIAWDKNSQFSGIMTLADGKTAKFTIDVDETDESLAKATRNFIKFLIANEPLIRHKVAVSMSELYQEWNDGETIEPEEFARRISLTGIDFWDEGAELYYEAATLFAGHCIWVSLDANGEIGTLDLAG